MDDAMAVNVTEAVQNLTEQTPGPVNIIVKAISDQITKSLDSQ